MPHEIGHQIGFEGSEQDLLNMQQWMQTPGLGGMENIYQAYLDANTSSMGETLPFGSWLFAPGTAGSIPDLSEYTKGISQIEFTSELEKDLLMASDPSGADYNMSGIDRVGQTEYLAEEEYARKHKEGVGMDIKQQQKEAALTDVEAGSLWEQLGAISGGMEVQEGDIVNPFMSEEYYWTHPGGGRGNVGTEEEWAGYEKAEEYLSGMKDTIWGMYQGDPNAFGFDPMMYLEDEPMSADDILAAYTQYQYGTDVYGGMDVFDGGGTNIADPYMGLLGLDYQQDFGGSWWN